jgi:hypothetical protein
MEEELKDALTSVLDHFEGREKKDYEEDPRNDHVYLDVCFLRGWLDSAVRHGGGDADLSHPGDGDAHAPGDRHRPGEFARGCEGEGRAVRGEVPIRRQRGRPPHLL